MSFDFSTIKNIIMLLLITIIFIDMIIIIIRCHKKEVTESEIINVSYKIGLFMVVNTVISMCIAYYIIAVKYDKDTLLSWTTGIMFLFHIIYITLFFSIYFTYIEKKTIVEKNEFLYLHTLIYTCVSFFSVILVSYIFFISDKLKDQSYKAPDRFGGIKKTYNDFNIKLKDKTEYNTFKDKLDDILERNYLSFPHDDAIYSKAVTDVKNIIDNHIEYFKRNPNKMKKFIAYPDIKNYIDTKIPKNNPTDNSTNKPTDNSTNNPTDNNQQGGYKNKLLKYMYNVSENTTEFINKA